MAFFEKIKTAARTAAKSAADSASYMLDIQKLNNRINEEKKKIAAAKSAVGEMVWLQYTEQRENAADIEDKCVEIKLSYEIIAGLEQQIATLKAQKAEAEEARSRSAETPANDMSLVDVEPAEAEIVDIQPAEAEIVDIQPAEAEIVDIQPAEIVPGNDNICPVCRAAVPFGNRFCGSCGHTMEHKEEKE